MRKYLLFVCALCIALTGCQQIDFSNADSVTEESRVEHVVFSVSDGQTEVVPFTRATMQDCGLTTLYVVVDGVLTLTQSSTDKNFGQVSLDLTHGEHTLSFVSGAEALTYTDGIFSPSGKVMDTFGKVVTLNVKKGMASQQIVLERMISRLAVVVTDGVAQDCAQVRISVKKHYGTASASTLLAGGDFADFRNTISIPEAYRSVANLALNTNTFCPSWSEEWLTDVDIDFLASDGTVLQHRERENVPLCRNRITNLSGAYQSEANASVSVLADWNTETTNEEY